MTQALSNNPWLWLTQWWRDRRLDRLQNRLMHGAERDRERAAAALLAMGEPGRAVLCACASLCDPQDRVTALLCEVQDPGFIGRLDFQLACGHGADVKLLAIRNLCLYSDARVDQLIERALVDRNEPSVRLAAAEALLAREYVAKTPAQEIRLLMALGRVEELSSFGFDLLDGFYPSEVDGEDEAFLKLLTKIDWPVANDDQRRRASEIALNCKAPWSSEIVVRLLNRAASAETLDLIVPGPSRVRSQWSKTICDLIANLETALLHKGLESPRIEVRRAAAETLATRDDDASTAVLIPALNDQDETLSAWAACGLHRRGWTPPDPTARALLVLCLAHFNHLDAAADAASGGEFDFAYIVDRLRRDRPYSAVTALCAIWTPEAKVYIQSVLRRRPDLADHAIDRLVKRGDSSAAQVLTCELKSRFDFSAIRVLDGLRTLLSTRADHLTDDDLKSLTAIPPSFTYTGQDQYMEEFRTHDVLHSFEVQKTLNCEDIIRLAQEELNRRTLEPAKPDTTIAVNPESV